MPNQKPAILLIDQGISHKKFINERTVNRGLLSIASFLEKYGYDVDYLSLDQFRKEGLVNSKSIHQKVNSIVASQNYLFIAVSNLFIAEFDKAASLIKHIKSKFPQVSTVIGGYCPTFYHEKILQNHPYIDFIGRGEGEWLLLNLARFLEDSSIEYSLLQGFTYRKNGNEIIMSPDLPLGNIADLPPLNYGLLDTDYLLANPQPHINIEIFRGCPHNCGFCSATRFWRHKVRRHGTGKLHLELKQLAAMGYAGKVTFEDETIDLRNRKIKDYFIKLKSITDRKYDFDYLVTRYDAIDKESMLILHDLGLKNILIGLESGSKTILESIHKKIDLDRFPQSCRIIKEAGLNVHVFIILGLPGESEATFNETYIYLENLVGNDLIDNILLSYYQPYNHTESYEKLYECKGFIIENDKAKWILRGGPLVEYPNLSRSRQKEMFEAIQALNMKKGDAFYKRF